MTRGEPSFTPLDDAATRASSTPTAEPTNALPGAAGTTIVLPVTTTTKPVLHYQKERRQIPYRPAGENCPHAR